MLFHGALKDSGSGTAFCSVLAIDVTANVCDNDTWLLSSVASFQPCYKDISFKLQGTGQMTQSYLVSPVRIEPSFCHVYVWTALSPFLHIMPEREIFPLSENLS